MEDKLKCPKNWFPIWADNAADSVFADPEEEARGTSKTGTVYPPSMNVLSEEKKQQAIALGRLGWSLRRIQCATRIRRETAAGYLKAAGIPVRPPRHPSASACEPYRAIIEVELSKGCSAMCIFQDLVDNHGFPGKSSSVKHFVRKLRGLMPLETRLMFPTTIGENRLARRLMARQCAFNWMRQVLQGEYTPTLLCSEMGHLPRLDKLLTSITEGRLSDRNRALAVLARNKGFSLTDVCGFLSVSKEAVLKYCRCYHAGGFKLLMSRKSPSTTKFDKEQNKQAVFSLLHTPPSAYGINRTTWRMVDLQAVLKKQPRRRNLWVTASVIEPSH